MHLAKRNRKSNTILQKGMMTMPFSPGEIYSFVGIVALLVMFPGPNTVLVMQSVGVHGRRAGFFNVLGIVSAVYCNALLSGLGLSFIILQSAEIYNLLKLLGAGYILYLGIASLVEAYRLHRAEPNWDSRLNGKEENGNLSLRKRSLACYYKGVLTGILNPKSALFFLAFFPQFIHQEGSVLVQYLILTALYSLVSATWYSVLVFFLGRLRQFLIRTNTQKWLKAITGTLLAGMGLRIALQK